MNTFSFAVEFSQLKIIMNETNSVSQIVRHNHNSNFNVDVESRCQHYFKYFFLYVIIRIISIGSFYNITKSNHI